MTRGEPHFSDDGCTLWCVRDFGTAIDRYIGELARSGRAKSTRATYYRTLVAFAQYLNDKAVRHVTPDDCRGFLDRWQDAEPATMALQVSILNGFFQFVADEDAIKIDPMARIRRPRVPNADDRAVTTVDGGDVARMLACCETWPETVCVNLIAYTGVRRAAAARLRWADVDMDAGTIRFQEKGAKSITKPIPARLQQILEQYQAAMGPFEPFEWVVPNRHPSKVLHVERSDKIIYNVVKDVARRAGVKSHVHALRAAYAVRFLESHPGQIEGLQALMGHSRIDTTAIYLRRLNRSQAMERVRGLEFGGPVDSAPATRAAQPQPAETRRPNAAQLRAGDMMADLADARVRQPDGESNPAFHLERVASSPLDDRAQPADRIAARRSPFPGEGEPDPTDVDRRQKLRGNPHVPHTGFEPVLEASPLADTSVRQPDDCALCGDPAKGFATINGVRYCHDGAGVSCYMRASWASVRQSGQAPPW